MANSSGITYTSSASDSDGDTVTCTWRDDPDNGDFSTGADCNSAVYNHTTQNHGNVSIINHAESRGGKTAECPYTIDVYDCESVDWPTSDVSGYKAFDWLGKPRAVPQSPETGTHNYIVNTTIEGPPNPPTFTYTNDALAPDDSTCGIIGGRDVSPFVWTSPDETHRGETCRVRSRAHVNNTTNWCQRADVLINRLPVLGWPYVNGQNYFPFSIFTHDVNACDGDEVFTMQSMTRPGYGADDPDPGDTEHLVYTWNVYCDSGDNGTFPSGNVSTMPNAEILWRAPVHSQSDNSEKCDVVVTVFDGFESNSEVYTDFVNITYTYQLEFNVFETPYEDCDDHQGTADGVSITYRDVSNSRVYTIVDGSGSDSDGTENGKILFDAIRSSSHTFNVDVFYSPECARWHLNCVPGEVVGGGVSAQISVTPSGCGVIPLDIELFEEELNSWEIAIDGDVYANSLDTDVVCAGEELGDGFVGSLLQFSDVSSHVDDAFAHTLSENAVDTAMCSPEADHCGFAKNTSMRSEWFDNVYTFQPPTHSEVNTVSYLYEVNWDWSDDRSVVNTMTASRFNSEFTRWGSLGYVPTIVRRREAGILYVPSGGSTLDISLPIHRYMNSSTYSDDLLIITDADVNIDASVGYATYGVGGYNLQARPNIEAGIITSGTINIEGAATPPDIPLLLQGPLVAENITFNRNLVLDNDMYPAVATKYSTDFLYYLTREERDPTYCDIDFTGLGMFDVQFTYGD
ncbi:hypothetical protein JXA34_03005 [Patescibacteria group bacterium]|nr:hypothetical protein [Patescibacteria group bacterium]